MGGDGSRGSVPQGGRGARLTPGSSEVVGTAVCRVLPDVPAVDRAFDYLVPDALLDGVVVGAIVRVPLHGRRVRGWVVETDIEPEVERQRLVALYSIVSAGPPADVVALCSWAAWRWAGPRSLLLRTASPPNNVDHAPPERDAAVYPSVDPPLELPDADRRCIRWPPGTSVVPLVHGLVDAEGSTIVVAPDASEDDELVRLLEAEGRRVERWRPELTDADHTATWDEMRRGACVVIGSRGVVFAPVPDLRSIIVLDDADETLKQTTTPAWHARDVAAERARSAGARLDIVSPAPTVEAIALAGEPITPAPVDERAGWPRTEVVDLRDEAPGAALLSARLADGLRRALDEGGRAICVLNRKGRARLLACHTCHELARCGRCGAAVGAEASDAFRCPRCGEERAQVCLSCGGGTFRVVRPGVVRVREELAALVPRARVIAVDASSAPLPAFDVAVGTEAVLHRVHASARDDIRLVAFLELDQELLAARYRAAEQALWLLVRAARLLGGRSSAGTLLLQTRLPADPVVLAASEGDPSRLVGDEWGRRESLAYPPFGGLAEIAGAGAAVEAACDALRPSARVLGPDRDRALVRSASTADLCDAIAAVDLAPARALGRLRVDVDPLRV